MDTLTGCTDHAVGHRGALRSPERNRYYYGKLLDAYHFELEQSYTNDKRWLLNRLSIGSGVLCGLRVERAGDGTRIRVGAGVAIDGLGREIVVPSPSIPIDPRQPTDDCGRPTGEPMLRGGVASIHLCYHECPRDPAPVLVDACGAEEQCEYGIIEERFRIQVRPGAAPPMGDLVPHDACARVFGQQPRTSLEGLEDMRANLDAGNVNRYLESLNFLRVRRGAEPIDDPGDEAGRAAAYEAEREIVLRTSSRRAMLCELFGRCSDPRDPCIPLATVRFDTRGRIVAIDNCSVRRPLFSNALLLDLILCLADRVDACCTEPSVHSLAIVSGDNQVGVAGEELADPLVVRVSEADGTPRNDEPVVFEALGDGRIGDGGGALGSTFTVPTQPDGTATLPRWQLGQAPGLHVVSARISAGMPNLVTFRATARRVVQTLPVVRAVWPPNASLLARDGATAEWFTLFLRQPRIQVTFDRRMSDAQLDSPDPWLGFYVVMPPADGRSRLTRMALARRTPSEPSLLGEPGVTETFLVRVEGTGDVAAAGTAMHMVMQPSLHVAAIAGTSAAAGSAPAAGSGTSPDHIAAAVNQPIRAIRCLVLMRAESGSIVAADPPADLLDAEFTGSALPAATLSDLAALPVGGVMDVPVDVWDAFVPVTGAVLPQSGDGQPGGTFHSWFEIAHG